MMDNEKLKRAIEGCILGTAVGDALGLACEGMSRARREKVFGPVDGYRFIFGKGMVSDDTEHTCGVVGSGRASLTVCFY